MTAILCVVVAYAVVMTAMWISSVDHAGSLRIDRDYWLGMYRNESEHVRRLCDAIDQYNGQAESALTEIAKSDRSDR